MPNIWKLLHPVSILVGVVATIGALIYLAPLPTAAAVTVAFFSFVLIAGLTELLRRIFFAKPKTARSKARGKRPGARHDKPHAHA